MVDLFLPLPVELLKTVSIYFPFFSRFSCRFSFIDLAGFFLESFLTSLDFPIFITLNKIMKRKCLCRTDIPERPQTASHAATFKLVDVKQNTYRL
jgi:hypothetical protein